MYDPASMYIREDHLRLQRANEKLGIQVKTLK